MRASSTVAALLGAALLLAGCGEDSGPAGVPGPEAGVESVAGAVAAAEAGVAGWTTPDSRFPRSEGQDPLRAVDVSSVEVSADGTVLTARFAGAGGAADEPCGADYTGHPVLGALAVVVVVAEFDPPTDEACSAVAHPREVEVVLPEPLGERTVVGLDGTPVAVDAAALACTGGWTFSLPADFEGAPDPQAALTEWLALDPSEHTAPEAGTPQTGWTAEETDQGDRVVYTAGDLAVTVSRSTRDEWLVTTVDCAPSAQVTP